MPIHREGRRRSSNADSRRKTPAFLSIVAMVETAWVMERAYRPEGAATSWDSRFLEPLVLAPEINQAGLWRLFTKK
jgi:hypothetical protein